MHEIIENINFCFDSNLENNFGEFEKIEKYLNLFIGLGWIDEDRRQELLKMEAVRLLMSVYRGGGDKIICCDRVRELFEWYGTDVYKDAKRDYKKFQKFLGEMYELYKEELAEWE